MAEGRTAIFVAAIGALATVTVGVMANWDKIAGRPATATPAPAPVPVAASPASAASAAPEQSPQGPTASVAGVWRDGEGNIFNISVAGNRLAYTQQSAGFIASQGNGEIEGRRMRYDYVSQSGDRGSCIAEVEPGDAVIAGVCRDLASGASWQFRIFR